MHDSPNTKREGTLKPLTESAALELMAEDHAHGAHLDRAATEQRLRASLTPGHGVAWVRMSDLISTGAGRVAGRGIDFEAELARRLRHPAEATHRAILNRSSALPPLDAFGRSRPSIRPDALGRS